MLVKEKVSFGHKGPQGWAEDDGLLSWPKLRSKEMVCHPGERSKKFCWYG